MYMDAFTLSALVDEFLDELVGGRIQDVLDLDSHSLGFEIYGNHRRQYLLVSADTQSPRVHRVPDRLRRGLPKPTQIGLLARRYLEGGRIEHVMQPRWERIIQFEITGPEGAVVLVIEPMERRSNVLLLQNGVILDCMRRVGPDENRHRLSLPNHEYKLPPPFVGRLEPLAATEEDISVLLQENNDPKRKASQLLSSKLLGLSPLLSREIVYRASGAVDTAPQSLDASRVVQALKDLVGPLHAHEWRPGVSEDEHGVRAFSVYPLTHLPGWRAVEHVSAAISAYYGTMVGPDAYNEAKKPAFALIEEARKRQQAKLASLEHGLKDEQEREYLQHSGQLILAYQYDIQPGQTELRAQYEVDGPPLLITLDPELSPLENAQRYFDRYNRAKRAQEGVPQLIKGTRNDLAYLAQLENDLHQAGNWPEIDDVMQALQSLGVLPKGQPIKRIGGGGRSQPMRLTRDGYVIWVGRNSRQNEQVTFKLANSQDLWLHARDVPGAHVVIRNDGRRIPQSIIDDAAAVAAFYSSLRSENHVIVDVTRCKYVKKIKGAGPGMVTYRNEETVTIAPKSEELFQNE